MRYLPTHEWAKLEGDIATIGISKFAAEQLNDITYVELPKVGAKLVVNGEFGLIETVKSTSPVYSPVAGEVVEINNEAFKVPETVTSDPLGNGWLIKVKVNTGYTLDHLLTQEQYDIEIAKEDH